ncbi:hypothetical protein ACLBXM_23065 [Xanthobacteraceae bacterium A53D]
MNTLTSTSALHGNRGFGRMFDAVSGFFAALGEARQMMATYQRLSRMSDSDLARIDVRREDIPQVVAKSV